MRLSCNQNYISLASCIALEKGPLRYLICITEYGLPLTAGSVKGFQSFTGPLGQINIFCHMTLLDVIPCNKEVLSLAGTLEK